MKFIEVDIKGFGPLVGKKFTFVDGMNVVYGPNESAKTTVHAAIFGGLCGVRRAQGQPEREDRAFEARHRPWDGGGWEVSTLVDLADGRKIRLTQDLASKIGSRAVDERSGDDVSSEIQFEGSIDGSVLLGLNRRSFRSTACVRQSEIIAALAADDDHKRDYSALQQALQQAATSAGQRDETAAAALRALDEFWRENVGLDDARSAKRPYRRWKMEVERRRQLLQDARAAHDRYLQLLAERDEAIAERDRRSRAVKLAEAVVERASADLLEKNAARAQELQAKHPVAPGGVSSDQTLADHVAHALTLWENAPPAPSLNGTSSDELTEQLAKLPERPAGELTPAQGILDAASDLATARKMLEQHTAAKPSRAPAMAAPQAAAPNVAAIAARTWSRARIPMIAVACLALAGIVAVALGAAALGAALLVAAVAAAGASFWFLRPTAAAAEAATVVASSSLVEIDLLEVWETQHHQVDQRIQDAEAALGEALAQHGLERAVEESVDAAFERYKGECGEREQQDRQARQRDQLKLALEQRKRAEEQHAAREEALAALREAATTLELGEPDPEDIAAKLRAWQGERQAALGAHDEAQREWAELEQLLNSRTLEELKEEARQRTAAADRASDGLWPAELDAVDPKVAGSELPGLRRELQGAAELAASRGQLAESEGARLKSVAEAEAELEEAQEELARVEAMGETLQTTVTFLQEAQRRVYESIAPALTKTLKEWLPRVAVCTNGTCLDPRYNDAHVDPETLGVRVRLDDGPWRNADVLSAGTNEQIYLLLRVALTEHLAKDRETVPLLLDEVTAQCDSTRRRALLDLLLELGEERQIILFTHEDAVLDWAKANLPDAAIQTLEAVVE